MKPIELYQKAKQEKLSPEELQFVQNQTEKYPWFGMLHFLMARHSHLENPKTSTELEAKASIFGTDRKKVSHYITQTVKITFGKKEEVQEKKTDEKTSSPSYSTYNSSNLDLTSYEENIKELEQTNQKIIESSEILQENAMSTFNWRIQTVIHIRVQMFSGLFKNIEQQIQNFKEALASTNVSSEITEAEMKFKLNLFEIASNIEISPTQIMEFLALAEEDTVVTTSSDIKADSQSASYAEKLAQIKAQTEELKRLKKIASESMNRFIEPNFDNRTYQTELDDQELKNKFEKEKVFGETDLETQEFLKKKTEYNTFKRFKTLENTKDEVAEEVLKNKDKKAHEDIPLVSKEELGPNLTSESFNRFVNPNFGNEQVVENKSNTENKVENKVVESETKKENYQTDSFKRFVNPDFGAEEKQETKSVQKVENQVVENKTETVENKTENKVETTEVKKENYQTDSFKRFVNPDFGAEEKQENKSSQTKENQVVTQNVVTESVENKVETKIDETILNKENLQSDSFKRFVNPDFGGEENKSIQIKENQVVTQNVVTEPIENKVETKIDETIVNKENLQSDSFKRFVNPDFGGEEKQVTKSVQVEENQVVNKNSENNNDYNSFKRFEQPSFDIKPESLDSKKYYEEPVEVVNEEPTKESILEKTLQSVEGQILELKGDEDSMKRFVSPEFNETSKMNFQFFETVIPVMTNQYVLELVVDQEQLDKLFETKVKDSVYQELQKNQLAETIKEPIIENQVVETIEEPVVENQVVETIEEPIIENQVVKTTEEPIIENQVVKTNEEPIIENQVVETIEEPVIENQVVKTIEEPVIENQVVKTIEEPIIENQIVETIEEPVIENQVVETIEEPIIENQVVETIEEPIIENQVVEKTEEPVIENQVVEKTENKVESFQTDSFKRFVNPDFGLEETKAKQEKMETEAYIENVLEHIEKVLAETNKTIHHEKVESVTEVVDSENLVEKVESVTEVVDSENLVKKVETVSEVVEPENLVEKVETVSEVVEPENFVEKVESITEVVEPENLIEKVESVTEVIESENLNEKVESVTEVVEPENLIEKVETVTEVVEPENLVEKVESVKEVVEPENFNEKVETVTEVVESENLLEKVESVKEVVESENTYELPYHEQMDVNKVEEKIERQQRKVDIMKKKTHTPSEITLKSIQNKFLDSIIKGTKEKNQSVQNNALNSLKKENEHILQTSPNNNIDVLLKKVESLEPVLTSKIQKESSSYEDFQIEAIEEQEITEKLVITETMAKVYAAQGEILKAIKIYQQLMIKHPAKTSQYEAKIQDLQK